MIPRPMPLFGAPYIPVDYSAFDPLDLNPYAWFDAHQQSEADLANIATLVDRSGNGRDFTQATDGNRPHLKHNILNGLKVVQFGQNSAGVAGSKFLDRASSFLSGLTSGHYFWLMRATNDGAIGAADGGLHGEMENHAGDSHVPYGDQNLYTGFLSTTRRTVGPTLDLTRWNILEEWSAANDWGLKINGWPISSSASNTVGLNGSSKTIGRGGVGSATLGYFRGQMAQMFYFPSKLSDSDANDLRHYLADLAQIKKELYYLDTEKEYATADRWRIRARDTLGSNDAFGMRELQAYASVDGTGTDLFAGGTAIGSHNDGSYPLTNAFNGNTADFWTSLGVAPPSGGHWIGRQTASPIQPQSFRMPTRGDFNESPYRYSIEDSPDAGANWYVQRTGGPITGNTWVVIPL
jgi:hypothetical protein